jgi:hypothetical protein
LFSVFELAADSGYDEMVSNVHEFQEWLSGVPGILMTHLVRLTVPTEYFLGIDEATALSNVIGYVESGEFDTIVFGDSICV